MIWIGSGWGWRWRRMTACTKLLVTTSVTSVLVQVLLRRPQRGERLTVCALDRKTVWSYIRQFVILGDQRLDSRQEYGGQKTSFCIESVFCLSAAWLCEILLLADIPLVQDQRQVPWYYYIDQWLDRPSITMYIRTTKAHPFPKVTVPWMRP